MIYYTTIAYKQLYREISLNLIETFLKNTEDGKLLIVTDDISYYDEYVTENIIVVKGPDCDGLFKYNLKYTTLEFLLSCVSIGDYVVYMDADCFFANKLLNTHFINLQDGLSVQLGARPDDTRYPSQLTNLLCRDKILGLHPDENQKYYAFREACFLFKVDEYFAKFVQEWKGIYFEVESKQLIHNNETFDIQIACFRSGLAINNLHKMPFVNIIKSKERNGVINTILA